MAENFSQNELNAQRYMENLVKESRIFMDTCSIIDAKILFWEHIKPYLRNYQIPISKKSELSWVKIFIDYWDSFTTEIL